MIKAFLYLQEASQSSTALQAVTIFTHTFIIAWLFYNVCVNMLSPHVSLFFSFVLLYHNFYITIIAIISLALWLRSSEVLARLVSWVLTKVVFNGHPVKMERLYLRFDRIGDSLTVGLDAENVIFGNPYTFVHSGFVYASKLRLRISIGYPSIAKLYSIFRFGADNTEPLGFQEHNKALYFGIINIEILEIEKVHVRFELCDGKLNTIELGKSLAQRELIAHHGVDTAKFPNCVKVHVRRAKGLNAKYTLVTLKMRQQKSRTSTHRSFSNPAWDQNFEFYCDDPNGLLDLEVISESVFDDLLVGQYFISLRYLIWDGFIDGWVPLLDEHYKPIEGAELDLSIKWEYKSNFSKPKVMRRLAALEMMNLLGEEDEKKSHSWALWKECPILFKLERLTLRDINISVRDLFTGLHGAEEKMYAGLPGEFSRDLSKKLNWSKLYDNLEATESVQCEDNKPHKVTIVEVMNVKSAHNKDGLLNAKELLDGLVGNLIFKVLKSRNLLGSAVVDVFAGVGKNVFHQGYRLIHGDTHIASKALDLLRRLSEDIENESRIVTSHLDSALHFEHAAENVAAEDADLFKPELMSGLLEKRMAHGIFHPWKLRLFSLRGRTIYYKSDKKRLRKINLKNVKSCDILDGVLSSRKNGSPLKIFSSNDAESTNSKSHGDSVLNIKFKNGQTMCLRLPLDKSAYDNSLTGISSSKKVPTLLEWKSAIDNASKYFRNLGAFQGAVAEVSDIKYMQHQSRQHIHKPFKRVATANRVLRPRKRSNMKIAGQFDMIRKRAQQTQEYRQ